MVIISRPGLAYGYVAQDRIVRADEDRDGAGPAPEAGSADRPSPVVVPVDVGHGGALGIVVPDGRVQVVEKQEVPSRRDGQLLFIATDYPGDKGDHSYKVAPWFLPALWTAIVPPCASTSA